MIACCLVGIGTGLGVYVEVLAGGHLRAHEIEDWPRPRNGLRVEAADP